MNLIVSDRIDLSRRSDAGLDRRIEPADDFARRLRRAYRILLRAAEHGPSGNRNTEDGKECQ